MRLLKITVGAALTGIGVALIYYLFEAAVRNAIQYVWLDSFNTNSNRILMLTLTLLIGFTFFTVQHFWDQKSEKTAGEDTPSPTLLNLIKVLFIGFLSLFAGASLGPEAILIPACLVVGGLVGAKISRNDKQITKLLGAAGFVALFVAFFSSFWAALFGLYLLKAQSGAKLKPTIIVIALIASVVTFGTLQAIEAPEYFTIPAHNWNLSVESIAVMIGLLIAGFLYTHFLALISKVVEYTRSKNKKAAWWQHALIASTGLAVLYLIGGSLIQFTGNESIVPMFEQAPTLGFIGLLWLVITKTSAIAWSKVMGYRGGMIFPTIFVAATLVAMAQFAVPGISVPLGMLVVLFGAFYADGKAHVLF